MHKDPDFKSTNNLTIPSVLKALATREIGLIIVLLVMYNVLLWMFPHHESAWILSKVVLLFSVIKVYYLLAFSVRRLKSCLACCHSFYDILGVYALILGIMVISFAVDYYCLMSCMPDSFLFAQTAKEPLMLAFDFLYFSIVTFATIGYGDIVPLVAEAKLLVLFEILSSFIMITFVISNVSRMSEIASHKKN